MLAPWQELARHRRFEFKVQTKRAKVVKSSAETND
jgi:hypothetical protein